MGCPTPSPDTDCGLLLLGVGCIAVEFKLVSFLRLGMGVRTKSKKGVQLGILSSDVYLGTDLW